jgi:hypothetical protein
MRALRGKAAAEWDRLEPELRVQSFTERYMHAKARPEDLEWVNLAFAARPSSDQRTSEATQ